MFSVSFSKYEKVDDTAGRVASERRRDDERKGNRPIVVCFAIGARAKEL